ncbi:MAG TPA: M20/M25/M40 family metallo-hydrolase [Sphingomicrobium sp.]|nr:M20/M25/M40 family metallo-hydrolase [Sphingomicrobium sp.]
MIRKTSRLILLPLAAFAMGAAQLAAQPVQSAAAQRVRAHVEFLASDLLEGRDTGSRGYDIAASYVVSQFTQLGLRPGGTNGSWYVPVPFRRATQPTPPVISFTLDGRTVPLAIGTDAGVRPSLVHKQRTISGGLVFVGRGLQDARLGIDDYAGLDVRGKIVVALDDRPRAVASDVAAHLGSTRARAAARNGAIGLIEVAMPRGGRPGMPGVGNISTRPATGWVDSQGRTNAGPAAGVATLALSDEWASRLFTGSRKSLAAIRSDAAAGKPVMGFALRGSLAVRSASVWEDFTSPQVVGVLPGADPRLAAEAIALMGHLDHLGVKKDARPGEDAIYNGALDNASGIATMLEAARTFVNSGRPPRRTVLFVANTGEEKGLLGADYFAANPTAPAGRIVGLVNLDMPLLLYDFRDVIAFGAEHSTIARAVADAASSMGVAVTPDPMPEQSLFVRSDHYPFVKQGVPSVFLMTGHANGGKPMWDKFLAGEYHSVADDLKQPLDWEAGARFAELNYRIARTLADANSRPLWYAGDYFGDSFAPGQPKARR